MLTKGRRLASFQVAAIAAVGCLDRLAAKRAVQSVLGRTLDLLGSKEHGHSGKIEIAVAVVVAVETVDNSYSAAVASSVALLSVE